MINVSADLNAMFADLGVVGSFNGTTTQGFFDASTVEILSHDGMGTVVGTRKTFRIKTGSLTGLKDGASIQILGVTYKVTKVRLENDGLETVLDLQG